MTIGEQLRKAREGLNYTASQVAAATRMKTQTVEAIDKNQFDRIPAPIYCKGFIKLYAEHVNLDPKPLLDQYVAEFAPKETESEKPAVEEIPKPQEHKRFAFLGGQPISSRAGEKPEKKDGAPKIEETGDVILHKKEVIPPAPTPKPAPAPAKAATPEPEKKQQPAQDPDLFSHIPREKRTWREPAPGLSSSEIKKMVAQTCSGFAQKISKLFGDKINIYRKEVFAFKFEDAPVKTVFMILGLIFVIILLISTVSRCARGGVEKTVEAGGGTQKELRAAVNPPDDYLD